MKSRSNIIREVMYYLLKKKFQNDSLNRWFNEHSVAKGLNLLNREQFPDLYLIIDGKLKSLQDAGKGEIKKSDGLEYEEVQAMHHQFYHAKLHRDY
ncbi:14919_t:CDS:2 [Funneliformis geosporum]|uniref:6323_t:CDS:1 n=1 Tax=Funneliformis geosporum TaxID=1117311 RepID=A0A9W4SJ74_9GLOM|nr:14919_t:CDS:2 [Funneliformis geosporum]CAI2171042.1 6323_t:CDS:2 [Funneliformis geosporum]